MAKANYDYLEQELLPSKGVGTESTTNDRKASIRMRVLRYFFYSTLASTCFLFFLLSNLDLSKFIYFALEKVFQQTNLEWNADQIKVGVLFDPKVTFQNLHIRPAKFNSGRLVSIPLEDELVFESFTIRPQLLQWVPVPGLRLPHFATSFAAQVFRGNMEGGITAFLDKNLFKLKAINIETQNTDLSSIADILKSFNFTAAGKTDLDIDLHFFQGDPNRGNGKVLAKGSNVMLELKKFGVPQLNLGSININSTVEEGKLSIQTFKIGAPNQDLDLDVSGNAILKLPQFINSTVNLKVKLKVRKQTKQQK